MESSEGVNSVLSKDCQDGVEVLPWGWTEDTDAGLPTRLGREAIRVQRTRVVA